MSKTKEHFHDQMESGMRLYNILELQKMSITQLAKIALELKISSFDSSNKQNFIYAILEKQAEITPALKGDLPTKSELQNKAPFRAGGTKQAEL